MTDTLRRRLSEATPGPWIRTARLCACGHPESDHSESNDGSCVYGWDDFQPLDDAEREADACPCEAFAMREEATR